MSMPTLFTADGGRLPDVSVRLPPYAPVRLPPYAPARLPPGDVELAPPAPLLFRTEREYAVDLNSVAIAASWAWPAVRGRGRGRGGPGRAVSCAGWGGRAVE